jgi:hypothetical protein
MAALLASKGQQLWMRPEAGVSAVQFHRSPTQFAAGWCKACFRGSSHFLSLDLGSLIGHYGSTGFEPTVSSPMASQVILQLIQRALRGDVQGNAAVP